MENKLFFWGMSAMASGGSIPIKTVALKPFLWDGGNSNNNYIIFSDFPQGIKQGDTYQLHIAGKSDKPINKLRARLETYSPSFEMFSDNVLYERSITANTPFDITLLITATKLCNSDHNPSLILMANNSWGDGNTETAVDPIAPVTLTLTTFKVTKIDGTVFMLNPDRGNWGSNNNYIIFRYFPQGIKQGDTYQLHIAGKSDKPINKLRARLETYSLSFEMLSDNVLYESSITANTPFDITLPIMVKKTCNSDRKPYLILMANNTWGNGNTETAVDPIAPVTLTLTTFTVTKR